MLTSKLANIKRTTKLSKSRLVIYTTTTLLATATTIHALPLPLQTTQNVHSIQLKGAINPSRETISITFPEIPANKFFAIGIDPAVSKSLSPVSKRFLVAYPDPLEAGSYDFSIRRELKEEKINNESESKTCEAFTEMSCEFTTPKTLTCSYLDFFGKLPSPTDKNVELAVTMLTGDVIADENTVLGGMLCPHLGNVITAPVNGELSLSVEEDVDNTEDGVKRLGKRQEQIAEEPEEVQSTNGQPLFIKPNNIEGEIPPEEPTPESGNEGIEGMEGMPAQTAPTTTATPSTGAIVPTVRQVKIVLPQAYNVGAVASQPAQPEAEEFGIAEEGEATESKKEEGSVPKVEDPTS